MPLPLLLMPITAAAVAEATTYSAGTLIAIAVGASAGGAGVTAGGLASWWYFWGKPQTVSENQTTLPEDVHVKLEQRIEEINDNQEERAKNADASRKQTADSLIRAAEVTESLNNSARSIESTTSDLKDTITRATMVTQSFFSTRTSLEKSSLSTHNDTEKTILELAELDKKISYQCDLTKNNLAPLLSQINELSNEIESLNDIVQNLTYENNSLKTELSRAQYRMIGLMNLLQTHMAKDNFSTIDNKQCTFI